MGRADLLIQQLKTKKIINALKKPSKILTFTREWLFDVKLKAQTHKETSKLHVELFQNLTSLVQSMGNTSFDYELKSEDLNEGRELAELLSKYGSDKATSHNYHLLYAKILEPIRNTKIFLMEIGLGTNNIDILSNMGTSGHPGASLRAFRDYLPSAEIIGADVDRRILFSGERIRTYYVDQTQWNTFAAISHQLPDDCKFDLIIDDGLHLPHANLNTLKFALGHLKSSGAFVVEDIEESYAALWHVVGKYLEAFGYKCHFIKTKLSYLFLLLGPKSYFKLK